MNDLISREEAIKAACRGFCHPGASCPDTGCKQLDPIKALPFTRQKTARWVRMIDSDDGYCSNCKCDMPLFREDWSWKYCATKFCPNCGAKMANWDGLEEEGE